MVRDMTSEAASSLAALLENLQRHDVNIVDECLAVAKICGKHGYSRKNLAATTGKSATWISTRLKLAVLPDVALERVRTGLLRVETAMELAKLPAADRVVLAESNEWEIKQKIRKNNAAKQFDAFMAALDAAGVAEKFRHVSDHKARAEHRRHCRMTDPKDVAEQVIHVRPMKTADLFYWDEHVGLSLYRHDSHFTDQGESKTSPAPLGVEPAAWTAYRESLEARRTWAMERVALVNELRLAAVAALTDKEVLALALKYMVLAVLEVTEYSYSNLIVTETEASAFGIDQGEALVEYDSGSDSPEYMAWAHEQATSKATMIPWLRVELCRTAFEADIPVEAAADAEKIHVPTVYVFAKSADEFTQTISMIGGFDKKVSDYAMQAVKMIGGIELMVHVNRSDMCEKIVVGTRQVEETREVYPDDVVPEVVTEMVDVDITEWSCPPAWRS
jgi:hypothetical protein